jgi:predicted nucleic acid-binding protein
MPNPVVIDASVAAKWFLTDTAETDTDLAEGLLLAILAGEVDAHAPGIFTREVCALLARAIGGGWITKADAIRCAREFFEIPVAIHEDTQDELVAAIEMAADNGKPFYDTTYLRLAVQLSCRWCTADAKILISIKPTLAPQIELLSTLR